MTNSDEVEFGRSYGNMPPQQYHALDCASRSALFPLTQGKTLAHVRAAMTAPNKPTPAMEIGTAFHAYTLQHDEFDEHCVEALDLPRRSNADKAAHAQHAAEHDGKVVLKSDDMQRVRDMGDAVLYHPAARSLFECDSVREATVLWAEHRMADGDPADELAPLHCKARPDMFIEPLHALVDVKTTQDASPHAFARSIVNFGYHFQAAWYLRGCAALGADVSQFIFVCVESAPPHCVAVYNLAAEVIAHADELLLEPMRQMQQAYQLDNWTAYSGQVEDIALPEWAMRDIYEKGLAKI